VALRIKGLGMRRITIGKVASNTDDWRMGRVQTEKGNWLHPISPSPYMNTGQYLYVPPVGAEVLIVDDKYYIGAVEEWKASESSVPDLSAQP